MRVEIFDVEHGGCALVTADTGARLLIDCGHNATTGWRPSSHLPSIGIDAIDRFFVTNYDEDHVSDLPLMRKNVRIHILHRNKSVSASDLTKLKSETGTGPGIRMLSDMILEYTHEVTNPPDLGALTFSSYCMYR